MPCPLSDLSRPTLVPSVMPSPSLVLAANNKIVIVRWSQPDPLPGEILRYEVVVAVDAVNPEGTLIYWGLDTEIVMDSPPSLDFRVRAVTAAGEGPFSSPSIVSIASRNEGSTSVNAPAIFAPVIVGLVLLLLVAFVAAFRYRKMQREQAKLGFARPKPDEWEIQPSSVVLGRKIGQGQFGVVFSATASNITTDMPGNSVVAVKVTTEDATPAVKHAFLEEATLMKQFSKPWHENVRLIVCCLDVLTRRRWCDCWVCARKLTR